MLKKHTVDRALFKELAMNLRWSWSHMADKIWKKLDPELWELTHNPWVIFQTVSKQKLEELLLDPEYCKIANELLKIQKEEASAKKWFQTTHGSSPLKGVAYFSMEFMLTEGLPIYSGGLGNVAGDLLKSASDLGVPVFGIGLLYQQGYFRQIVSKNGEQVALYPYNDPGQLPIEPLRKENGEWLRLKVQLPGYALWIRVWEVKVGRVKLFLLDTNDAANYPPHRAITSELYGGGKELRLQQEILLGIGGWRLLEALNISPEVCHMNEGHAAFAVLERAYSLMKNTKKPFEVALAATRAGNLFTTHTAVAAGFDCFCPRLIERYLGKYAEERLGITLYDLLALGRKDPNDSSECFNMAYLAVNGSAAVNAVSKLHAEVSKKIFQPLFPRWPVEEVPVGYVTNGVHMPCWDSEEADKVWTEYCGKDRWLGTFKTLEEDIRKIPDQRLWDMRNHARKALINEVRVRLERQMMTRGDSLQDIAQGKHLFNPNRLTLGFARRFATYKRPNMLLQNPERLLKILTNPSCPVQLIIAGKAHPADKGGQRLIEEWMHFLNRTEARPHVIFLSDYDMQMTEMLVQGVDLWINTPRRPWEACGTSGMKVLVNGGLNLSELDGWWAEAYTPKVGWALGDGKEHEDIALQDKEEGERLLEILEKEVVPAFYRRDASGIPSEWIEKMRESMALLTPRFSANRAVREYTEKYYLPAASNYCKRAKNNAEESMKITDSKHALENNFKTLHFGDVNIKSEDGKHAFEVQLDLNGIDSSLVAVELFANGGDTSKAEKYEMEASFPHPENPKSVFYKASIPSTRPASDYTPRVVSKLLGASIPLEENKILWQK